MSYPHHAQTVTGAQVASQIIMKEAMDWEVGQKYLGLFPYQCNPTPGPFIVPSPPCMHWQQFAWGVYVNFTT